MLNISIKKKIICKNSFYLHVRTPSFDWLILNCFNSDEKTNALSELDILDQRSNINSLNFFFWLKQISFTL